MNPSQSLINQPLDYSHVNAQIGTQILLEAITLAQARGAFNIREAGTISLAVRFFNTPPSQPEASRPEDIVAEQLNRLNNEEQEKQEAAAHNGEGIVPS